MAKTKFEVFKIEVTDNENFELGKAQLDVINSFLDDPNTVYINHSSVIATEGVREYNSYNQVSKYLVVSIVYKDLKDTPLDLSKATKKTVKTTKKAIEQNEKVKEPTIATKFETQLNSKSPK